MPSERRQPSQICATGVSSTSSGAGRVTSQVPSPALAPQKATLRVRLRGGTTWSDIPDDHHFAVRVAGVTVIDARFDGVEIFDATVPLPANLLGGDVTPVEVVPQFDSGAPFDLIYIDAIGLSPDAPGYQAVLAHELQHAVHWAADPGEETWLNEGLSELAMNRTGFRPTNVRS